MYKEWVAAPSAEVEKVCNPELVEAERIISHLDQIVLSLVCDVCELDGSLDFAFPGNLLTRCGAQQINLPELIPPKHYLLDYLDGELPQILYQRGDLAQEVLRHVVRS